MVQDIRSQARVACVAVLALLLAAPACTTPTPARIVAGRTDTLVIHHTRPIALPAVAVNAAGDTLPGGITRWRRVSGDTVALADTGTVHCTRRSETVVAAEAGAVSRQFVVRCRPLKGFVWGAEVLLRPGSAPQPFPIYAIGTDDEPITDLAAEVGVVDTAVAELVGGSRVRAKRPGGTALRVRAGDCRTTIGVSVVDRVDDPFAVGEWAEHVAPTRLVGSEYRTWRVPVGHLELSLDGDAGAQERLRLDVAHANCAALRSAPQGLSCITTDSTVVVVRRLGRGKDRVGSDSGALVIRRAAWGRQSVTAAARQRAPVRESDTGDTLCPLLMGWTPKGQAASR
ncbi:MAG: hypothetical protein LCH84_08420 [Gemmatimonadetes bacterium]|nr:hypothetical protein [Gemmatimonadota bacterium]